MKCKNCGKEVAAGHKFCTGCGTQSDSFVAASAVAPASGSGQGFFRKKNIPVIIFVALLIGAGIYNSISDFASQKNNQGTESFLAGDSKSAIKQLEQSSNTAISDADKIVALKNLGYVYLSELQDEKAMNAFKEARALTDEGSFNYHLVSGEIALLENRPAEALDSFNAAAVIDSRDYQLNNTLGVFYLDMYEKFPDFADSAKAVDYAKKAYEIQKDAISAQNLAISYYIDGNNDEALNMLNEKDVKDRTDSLIWFMLAYAGKGDIENAKLYLQKATDAGVEVPPDIAEVIRNK